MSHRRIAFVAVVGLVVGAVGLAAQQPPHEHSTTGESRMVGHDMAQMRSMCQQMAGMMSEQGTMTGQGMMGGEGMMGGQGMMGRPGMMGPGAAVLLSQKDALQLTDAQVERLTEISQTASATEGRHLDEIRRLDEEIQEVLDDADPDLDHLETLFEQRAAAQVQVRMAQVRATREARSLLTDEQRSNLRYGSRLMHGMMRQMMDRMSGDGNADDSGAHEHDGGPRE